MIALGPPSFKNLISGTHLRNAIMTNSPSQCNDVNKYLHQAKEKLEDQALDRGKDPGPEKNLRDCGTAPTGVYL